MSHLQFSNILYLIRLYAFEICETIVFVCLGLGLTIHTIRLVVDFTRRKKRVRPKPVTRHLEQSTQSVGRSATSVID
jgi:hypothetical protein